MILPTDTVYGLVADGSREAPVRLLARLKRRPAGMAIAVLAASLDAILEAVPELDGPAAHAARALLPGPFTLVLPNPARRLPWLCEANPFAIGIRVPVLPEVSRCVVQDVGFVCATSANLHGGPDPRRLADIPPELLAAAAATVDGGTLPGVPSTVIDLTEPVPKVLRAGAGAVDEALRRLRQAGL